eukprot:gene10104-7071_t
MLRGTAVLLKKGWTHTPGRTRRGGKNLAWRPKISEAKLNESVRLNLVHPRRHPNTWQERQFNYLGYTMWPKELGFYNAGDNFELTPEASWRIYLKCRDEPFWSRLHNEQTVVHLLPLVEKNPEPNMKNVTEVFRHHLCRFGADHYIYNVVMQAAAFGKRFSQCETMLEEMNRIGLEPNGQTYVNMMLGARLSGLPREKAEKFFKEGVQKGALTAVMRLDTEFQMWMDQLDRLGSFTTSGHLSINEEGASPMPRDMFAIWGWHKSEAKFRSRKDMIEENVRARVHAGRELIGTVYTKSRRQPWSLYGGMLPHDFNGPPQAPPTSFPDAPPPENDEKTSDKAW